MYHVVSSQWFNGVFLCNRSNTVKDIVNEKGHECVGAIGICRQTMHDHCVIKPNPIKPAARFKFTLTFPTRKFPHN